MEEPTIGRRVWYRPNGTLGGTSLDPDVPFDAGVVFVNKDGSVNLDVTDHTGQHHAVQNVEFFDADSGDSFPGGHYVEWMPYQKNKAKERK